MEFLEGSVKQLSKKLPERTIALHQNCMLSGCNINLHTAPTSEVNAQNFTASDFLKFLLNTFLCGILNENYLRTKFLSGFSHFSTFC